MLRGQVGFLLNFSGIVEFYFTNENCNWDEITDREYMTGFEGYCKSASAVFDLVKDGSEKIDYLWERSVLSKGRYFTGENETKWNLLSSNGSGKNVQRDHSWRRLLRLPLPDDVIWSERQEYIKAVLDDPDFNADDVKGALTAVCDASLKSNSLDSWQRYLIKYSELFSLCRQGFIVMNGEETVLLHESQRNHKQSELFSRALHLELKEKSSDIYPFESLDYHEVKSGRETAYVELSELTVNGREFVLDIWYELDTYILMFYADQTGDFSTGLNSILAKHSFAIENGYEGYESETYLLHCKTSNEIFNRLKALCTDLAELENE
jgi:hypothetical protein